MIIIRDRLFLVTICNLVVVFSTLIGETWAAPTAANTAPSARDLWLKKSARDFWLKKKEQFYAKTKFPLSDENLKLLGAKRLNNFSSDSLIPSGHLPFWFDYELFKRVFNKSQEAPTRRQEIDRHNVYLNTCVRVLKQRVLYRMLAGTSDSFITSDADQFYWEKFGQIETNQSKPIGGNTDDDGQESKDQIKILASFKPAENEIQIDDDQQQQQQQSGGKKASAGDVELEHCDDDNGDECPLRRALRLVQLELGRVESKNQVEHYLRAFNEVDGSAIAGQLPY